MPRVFTTTLLLLASLALAATPLADSSLTKPSADAPGVLTVSALIQGSVASLSVTGIPAEVVDRDVWYGWSIKGSGPSDRKIGPCGLMTIQLSKPVHVLGHDQVKAGDTHSSLSFFIPATAPIGLEVWFQALDLENCELTNNVSDRIQ